MPSIPKDEERKGEKVLKHIDEIARQLKNADAIKKELREQGASEAERKKLRLKLIKVEAAMLREFEAIKINKKQIDRIVARLKAAHPAASRTPSATCGSGSAASAWPRTS